MDRSPRYRKGDQVCFFESGEKISGRIVNIDMFGFEEFQYDIFNDAENSIWKHVEESAITPID